jgi:dihydropyrimidinase
MALTGKVETVLSRGRVVVSAGEFRGSPKHGRYLKRGLNQLVH